MRLKDKVAIVTGGASGFGAGIVRKFIAEGAQVVIADLNTDMGTALAGELGDAAKVIRVDVANRESVEALTSETLSAFGQIDILVNNAGVTHLPAPLDEVSEADFDKVFAVNCKSVYLTAQTVVPHMRGRGSGAILNVASTAGVSPRPRLNWYNASKGWMITATRTMAVELAPRGIRVNSVAPTFVETPMTKPMLDDPEFSAFVKRMIPLGTVASTEDIAEAVLYLCGPAGRMITGHSLVVDGGWTAQ